MSFRDRVEAGKRLATKLAEYEDRADVVVVALPRGGVPVAYEVARAIHAPLGVVLVRRITVSADGTMTIGAVGDGGIRVLDEPLIQALQIPAGLVEEAIRRAESELVRYAEPYRDCRGLSQVAGRTVLLVDDGIATGASIDAAVAVVQAHRPAAIVVAVPVASYAACAKLAGRVRDFVSCYIRDPVYAVRLWYDQYPPVLDEEALSLLRKAAAVEPQTAEFSSPQYRELGADATTRRERDFEQRGFGAGGPELGESEHEPSVPAPRRHR